RQGFPVEGEGGAPGPPLLVGPFHPAKLLAADAPQDHVPALNRQPPAVGGEDHEPAPVAEPADLLAGGRVPEVDRGLVGPRDALAGRGDPFAVRRERDALGGHLAEEPDQFLAGGWVPHAHGAVGPPEATALPSGEKATARTSPPWRRRVVPIRA